jgi:hypothetical protein
MILLLLANPHLSNWVSSDETNRSPRYLDFAEADSINAIMQQSQGWSL